MARLTGTSVSAVQNDRLAAASRLARESGCHVVLKGAQTVVACPEGDQYINPTGNPGMGTGGTGDILAGLLGRLIAGWVRRSRAAGSTALADYLCAAVYLHGRAGDIAAAEKGEESLVATDLLVQLADAIKEAASGAAAGLPPYPIALPARR
jgi:NAD(P)H-hydrate epimerase